LALAALGAPLSHAAAFSDFDGNGRSDILWRHEGAGGTGDNYLYPMDGSTILPSEGYLRAVADQNWKIAAVGDFDADGKADILWRNSATGENYIYLMDGRSIVGEGFIRTVADQNWQVVGTGRFDSGDTADVLWRNNVTGENYVYLMQGLAITGEGYMRTVADQAWQVVGIADFDGDSRDDILWRNTATGENYVYPMDGTAIKATEGFIRTVADQAWQVAGVGYLDADTKADIVWRNRATGENYVYPMDGTAILSGEGYIRTVADQSWQIAALGDFDGDGSTDLVWRNSATGENYLYPMQGLAILPSEGYLRRVTDQKWRVASGPAQQRFSGEFDAVRTACDAGLPSNASDAFMYARAMELCHTAAEHAPFADRRWGVIGAQVLLADGTGSPSAQSRAIRMVFGTNGPQFGSSLVVLSTGHAAAPGQTNPSFAAFQPGAEMLTQSAFPADWFSANGNTLPVAPGCPPLEGSQAHDPIMLKLRIRVPSNARSFQFSTRFFSSDYPEYVCSPFNDFYVVLLDSSFTGEPANPADKNLARYTPEAGGSYLVGVNLAHGNTGLFQACENGQTGCATFATPGSITTCTDTSPLSQTGFDTPDPPASELGEAGYCGENNLLGGGTGPLKLRGNVVPGETIELRFTLWETTDGLYDVVALIDDFEWSEDPTTPGAFLGN
jgi:hypothetical protein